MTKAWEPEWISIEDDGPPSRGMFVELGRPEKSKLDRFGLEEAEIRPIDRIYWPLMGQSRRDLYWRPASAISSKPVPMSHSALPKDADGRWHIVRIDPQLEVTTVWRVHELGKELFTPMIRERRATRKRDKNGQKICELRPKPMFRGYGFIRRFGLGDTDKFLDVRGVADFLRDDRGQPITLPHEAVLAIFAKQWSEHQLFIQAKGGRVSQFKPGDMVKIDEGSVYSGLIAQVEKLDAKGRVAVLLGMIRHWMPADMVVAA